MLSVLRRCWLGGRKGIRPVKKLSGGVLAWLSICLERDADLHMAQLMPLPLTVSCFSEIQIGFTFLVAAHPGSPGQRAVKRVCVCVCVRLARAAEISISPSIERRRAVCGSLRTPVRRRGDRCAGSGLWVSASARAVGARPHLQTISR